MLTGAGKPRHLESADGSANCGASHIYLEKSRYFNRNRWEVRRQANSRTADWFQLSLRVAKFGMAMTKLCHIADDTFMVCTGELLFDQGARCNFWNFFD
jgi:hypothetical protein